jgi:hypothetical protein
MMTIGTGMAWGSNALKDLVQGRGGETGDQHALRDRRWTTFAKKFGWNSTMHGPADQFLGNYVESYIMLGGLGFLSDLMYQAAQSADNGAWGYERFIASLLGPSADLIHLGYEGGVVGKDLLTGASSPSVERSNARALAGDAVRRIPIFGGTRSIASWLTNELAGPPNQKASAGFWGGG